MSEDKTVRDHHRHDDASLSAEAEMVLKSMVGTPPVEGERRAAPRQAYTRNGTLQNKAQNKQASIFTRDIHPHGAGFVTSADVSNVDGATLKVPGPDGKEVEIHCRVRRARRVSGGWYEGMIEFSAPVAIFSETKIRPR